MIENSPIFPEKNTATITISGMACQEGCADKIAENLTKTEGVVSAEVSYETGEAIVQYDNLLITMDKIKQVITDTKVKEYVYSINKVIIKNEIVE